MSTRFINILSLILKEWEWEWGLEWGLKWGWGWEWENSNTNNLNIVTLIMRQASMNFAQVPFGQMKIDLKHKVKLKGWKNS